MLQLALRIYSEAICRFCKSVERFPQPHSERYPNTCQPLDAQVYVNIGMLWLAWLRQTAPTHSEQFLPECKTQYWFRVRHCADGFCKSHVNPLPAVGIILNLCHQQQPEGRGSTRKSYHLSKNKRNPLLQLALTPELVWRVPDLDSLAETAACCSPRSRAKWGRGLGACGTRLTKQREGDLQAHRHGILQLGLGRSALQHSQELGKGPKERDRVTQEPAPTSVPVLFWH